MSPASGTDAEVPAVAVSAHYEVFASTFAEGEMRLDPDAMSPEQMADAVESSLQPWVGVCHQCSHVVDDPQVGDLIEFNVGDRRFSLTDGAWQEDAR